MLPNLAEGSNYLRGLDVCLAEGYFLVGNLKTKYIPHHVLSYKKACKLIRTQSYHYWPAYYFATSCFPSGFLF